YFLIKCRVIFQILHSLAFTTGTATEICTLQIDAIDWKGKVIVQNFFLPLPAFRMMQAHGRWIIRTGNFRVRADDRIKSPTIYTYPRKNFDVILMRFLYNGEHLFFSGVINCVFQIKWPFSRDKKTPDHDFI